MANKKMNLKDLISGTRAEAGIVASDYIDGMVGNFLADNFEPKNTPKEVVEVVSFLQYVLSEIKGQSIDVLKELNIPNFKMADIEIEIPEDAMVEDTDCQDCEETDCENHPFNREGK